MKVQLELATATTMTPKETGDDTGASATNKRG